MNTWDFNKIIDRSNTKAVKVDGLINRFGKADLIPFWVADMDFEVFSGIVDALECRLSHHIYGYSCTSDSYWQSIIDWCDTMHDFKVSREELEYVPGVVKGIAMAINYFTAVGDKIVIQPPVYHPFKMVTEGNKRVIIENPIVNNGGKYTMDFENLENLFVEHSPKMMILCNPHNPIGITWGKEVLSTLATLCLKYNVIVISDEIHSDLAIFGNKHTPFASVSDDAAKVAITFGAPSKTFNIPGLVSSWVVIKNETLRKPFFEWLEANEFCDPTFVATIATEAAYNNGKEWLNDVKKYIEQNILHVEEFCKNNIPSISVIRPEASFLVWLDCRALNLNHEQLIDLFVNKAGLALNDGEMFGCQGKCHMRFNVATSRLVLDKGLEQLAKAIKTI